MTKTILSIAAITALLAFSGCSTKDSTVDEAKSASSSAVESTSKTTDDAKAMASDAADSATDKAEEMSASAQESAEDKSLTDKAVDVADEHTDGAATKAIETLK